MFENSVKIKPIVYRFPRMIWSVNQIELFGFFTDLGILTSASINLVFNKELLIIQCEVRNKISVKQEKVCSTRFPVMSLTKNTGNLYTFFSVLFQQKIRPHGCLYGRLCRTRASLSSTLIRAVNCNATCLLSSCSNRNDGHTVALTDFYRCL